MAMSKRFDFWRVLIALTHVDGVVDYREKEFFIDKFDKENFDQNERAQLVHELTHPQDPLGLFNGLESLQDKAECLYMSNMVFASDGNYDNLERAMYAELVKEHTSEIDVDAILKSVDDDFNKKFNDEYNNKSGAEKAIDWIVSILS